MENCKAIRVNKFFHQLVSTACLGLVPTWYIENTAIPGYDDLYELFAYDRLRGGLNLEHSRYPDLSATVMVDNETLYLDESASLSNKTSIYRAYLSYQGSRHSWIVGKQRIPLGVGKFWNPIDVFNPIDIQAIEPGERKGTESIRYEYGLSTLSFIDAIIANGKGALRVKGYLDVADLAFIGEWDQDGDFSILGWEAEGELSTTGIELRTEGGLFFTNSSSQQHSEFILGAEYGFINSLVLIGEYHYNGQVNLNEGGISASFQPDLLWICHLLVVQDLGDGSGFASPEVEYSLSDEMTLSGGAFLYYGSTDSHYGIAPDRLFLRWFLHF